MNKTRGGICLHQDGLHYNMIKKKKNSPLLSSPSNPKGLFFMKIPPWSGRCSRAVIPVPHFVRKCKTKAWFRVCGDEQPFRVLGAEGDLVAGNTSNGSHSKEEGSLWSEDGSKLGWRPIHFGVWGLWVPLNESNECHLCSHSVSVPFEKWDMRAGLWRAKRSHSFLPKRILRAD